MSLLFKKPRMATVTPVVPTELLRIGQKEFDSLMSSFPEVRDQVSTTAARRREEDEGPPR